MVVKEKLEEEDATQQLLLESCSQGHQLPCDAVAKQLFNMVPKNLAKKMNEAVKKKKRSYDSTEKVTKSALKVAKLTSTTAKSTYLLTRNTLCTIFLLLTTLLKNLPL